MADVIPNVVISMPNQLFTLARKFQAVSNGKIYIGKIDSDPTLPQNQIQVYLENEDGSHIPVSQPLIINQAGFPVYNGQIAKFVTVEGHSMAVYDSYGAQQFYYPNVLKYDPDQFDKRLLSNGGAGIIGTSNGSTVQEFINNTADDIEKLKIYSTSNDEISKHKYSMHGAGKSLGAENTIVSCSLLANYFDVIDVDISTTLDGVAILMHDINSTPLDGITGSVANYTYSQIKDKRNLIFDGTPFEGTTVTKWEDFVIYCASRGKYITAELKNTQSTSESMMGIFKPIMENNMIGRVNLQCLNIQRLKDYRAATGDDATQLLVLVYDGMPNEDLDYVISEIELLGNSGINADINYSRRSELVEKAKEKNITVNFWTAKQYSDELSLLSEFPGHQISIDYMVV